MPVYNAESYLAATLESVLRQTLDSFEVIAVNDGSTDSSLEILENYSLNNPALRVISKENGGPSSARNTALELAGGDYVFFLDADDLLEPDSLEVLYLRAQEQKADLVIANYDIFNQYKTTPIHNLDDMLELDDISRYDPRILWTFALWNKLFSMDVIRRNGLIFPPIDYSEDGVFVMNYVFRAKRITGLPREVLHYRRMVDESGESITSRVSGKKVKDYLKAHELIEAAIVSQILRDYPHCETIEDARREVPFVSAYLGEFLRKKAQILIDQFYRHFWELDSESRGLITEAVSDIFLKADLYTCQQLMNSHTDLDVGSLETDPGQVKRHAVFSAVFYSDRYPDKPEKMTKTVRSLCSQNLVRLDIVFPEFLRDILEKQGLISGNMTFLPADSMEDFYSQALDYIKSPYTFFFEAGIHYSNTLIRQMHGAFLKSNADYLIRQLYLMEDAMPRVLYLHETALGKMKWVQDSTFNPESILDSILGNKFFRTEFLINALKRVVLTPDSCVQACSAFQKFGRYKIFANEGVVFDGTEADFADFLRQDEAVKLYDSWQKSSSIRHLDDAALALNPAYAWTKLMPLPKDTVNAAVKKRFLELFEKLPVKNQVLFFSIRADDKLEGNAAMLYPHVRGKKIVRAKMGKPSWEWEMRTYYEICTSKVIVTDDYIRYLRHVRIRDEQRVIQLWHACGAFKKFGRHGTNIPLKMDMATHAQYNLVSVSGKEVCGIYADAFAIEREKVVALGVPRTDMFFDKEYQQKVREKVFEKYPQLRGKKLFVYAPTFRDIGQDRSRFSPDLDFEKLGEELPEDQILLICPHPLMTEPILQKTCENILEIRDFSTNEMMFVSDGLITDYSSVIFEYVLLRRPIAFFCYDLATYNRGFYLRYPEDLPGPVLLSQKELTDYLRDESSHTTDSRYEAFIDRYMGACDGRSGERIAEIINEYTGA